VAAWAGGIYYNKALLAKVGSAPASTWDEFLTLCGKFKAMGITPYFGGGQPDVVVEALIGSHFKTAGYRTQPSLMERRPSQSTGAPARLVRQVVLDRVGPAEHGGRKRNQRRVTE